MKKILIYLAGLVSGVILTILAAVIINNASGSAANDNGLTIFPERGAQMEEPSYKVIQSIDATHALAMGLSDEKNEWYRGILVLLTDDNAHFYDDQIVKTVPGKKFYQIGTYRYQTKTEDVKTVPVVALLDIE